MILVLQIEIRMLEKSNRFLRLRNVQGKNVCVVREVYRREDIPCQSEKCLAGCETPTSEHTGLYLTD